ncbi:hypothetical protein L288_18830 [Sphingobium quisquiliarum P25]|uniref:Uncharacterized protein n=1 Tax=Sphingobium quisquiliarum P25 TaxID=1329909 RepID=T0HR06_9SPHN|nr:hypothetical protein [Sphingobium quisquiliarum]EQA99968.1 hypothetical protein L288_18830 [Sphingobium quisquiliarum P25]EZP73615.1 hypothetical protein BV96_01056 [Sphingomonas paucimobilis]
MTQDTAASAPAAEDASDLDIAREIASVDFMSLPSRHEIIGNPGMVAKAPTKVTALAPEHREGILAQLSTYPAEMREEMEAKLVQEKAAELVAGYRRHTGPGDGATEFHKERWAIAREIEDLNRELDHVLLKLTEVAHIDPKTGEQTLRYPIGHPRRTGLEAEMDRINHAINLLTGVEGEKRLKTAMDKSIAAERARRAELADAAEVERRAKHLAREAELNRRAESKARFLSSNVSSWN